MTRDHHETILRCLGDAGAARRAVLHYEHPELRDAVLADLRQAASLESYVRGVRIGEPAAGEDPLEPYWRLVDWLGADKPHLEQLARTYSDGLTSA